ncbi:hypothetical protein J7I84_08925 [Arthrobacter sp. ISL-85]|uniref:hypothetical protein n=1 Tax=Arthrobacter sp. ISL-85 TaxID=2819115 RepID=UPI001BEC4F90|nr:hypothetical protein [Arthrobacter sp. ISL-85]MBT2566615.1 hypothetical protein [Arthrobacter sp. ISL-85]
MTDQQGNNVDGEVYVPYQGTVQKTAKEFLMEQVEPAVQKTASLPLFALVRNPERPSRAWICKLGEGSEHTTYSMIAEGEWSKLSEDIDYLHAGEDALHGPR